MSANPYQPPADSPEQPTHWKTQWMQSDPQRQQPATGQNGLAIAGMVLGIVACIPYGWILLVPAILAVIFGHRSFKVIKRTGQSGKGFAITAVATGWTSIAGWVIFMAIVIAAAVTGDTGSSAGGY